MALQLLEGFDHFSASILPAKGWGAGGGSAAIVGGRLGQAACVPIAPTALQKTLPGTYSTIIAGAGIVAQDPNNNQGRLIDFATAAGGFVGGVGIVSNQLALINNGVGFVKIGPTRLISGNWNYIEVKLVIGTSGSIEVKLNGVIEIAATIVNTGTTNLAKISLVSQFTNNTFDDVYVLDTSGSKNNTYLGDIRVETLFPTADGAHTAWAPDSGTAHFSRVNENTGTHPDGDTSYVLDSSPGDRDTYTMSDLSETTGTVFGAQTSMYARKDDGATRQIARVIRQSGTDHDGTAQTLTSSYVFYTQLDELDPAGSDWTTASVNADEFGLVEIA